MIAVAVHFLTGRYVATSHHDRDQAEWPPHPARLFSAMVAAWADAETPDPDERRSLEWLEALDPPRITASDATPRSVTTHYVPVNDTSVVSRSWYDRRFRDVETLEDDLEAALEASGGEADRTVVRLQEKLVKVRDVTGQVGNVGRTPLGEALRMLPDHRDKQGRSFPSVTPHEPIVTFTWDADPDDAHRQALDRLLARVTRLGHSSSLVSCVIADTEPTPTLEPGSRGRVLRAVRSGMLAALEREYAQHRGSKPRSLPFHPVTYRETLSAGAEEVTPRPVTGGEWIMFEFAPRSRSLPATRLVEVTRTLKAALLHHADDPPPEGLSGHRPDGSPTVRPHAAFVAVPHVASEHADGRLLGAAVILPEMMEDLSRQAILRAVGTWETKAGPPVLTLGRAGVLELIRRVEPIELVSLRRRTWAEPSHRWVSVTPIALPTHPGSLGSGTTSARAKAWARAEEGVVAACRYVGLPDPSSVTMSLDPFIRGARPAPTFPPFRQTQAGGRPVARRLVHAAVTFDRPVAGPLLLGAGRYLGLGLMRPRPNPE